MTPRHYESWDHRHTRRAIVEAFCGGLPAPARSALRSALGLCWMCGDDEAIRPGGECSSCSDDGVRGERAGT